MSIRAVLVGAGAMNSHVARLLLDRGVDIVGTVARSRTKIGRDVGEVFGLGRTLGEAVTNDHADLYAKTRPHIALVATASFMPDVYETLLSCVRASVNVITISEELLFPWATSPRQAAELDLVAKEHAVTIVGGGFQDYFMVNQVAGLLGTVHSFDVLRGRESFNVDDYGPEVAHDQRVGYSQEAFKSWLRSSEHPASFGRPVLGAVAAGSNLDVSGYTTTIRPVVAAAPTYCRTLEVTVRPGQIAGFTVTERAETAQGPALELEISGYVYPENQADVCEWHVVGDPSLTVSNPRVDTLRSTCTQMVNRVPDVIAARPGLVSSADLPPLPYRHGTFKLPGGF